jgi:hypothetical protein
MRMTTRTKRARPLENCFTRARLGVRARRPVAPVRPPRRVALAAALAVAVAQCPVHARSYMDLARFAWPPRLKMTCLPPPAPSCPTQSPSLPDPCRPHPRFACLCLYAFFSDMVHWCVCVYLTRA